jgi:hypothetical protein
MCDLVCDEVLGRINSNKIAKKLADDHLLLEVDGIPLRRAECSDFIITLTLYGDIPGQFDDLLELFAISLFILPHSSSNRINFFSFWKLRR